MTDFQYVEVDINKEHVVSWIYKMGTSRVLTYGPWAWCTARFKLKNCKPMECTSPRSSMEDGYIVQLGLGKSSKIKMNVIVTTNC